MHKVRGFTLIELLLTVLIIGIAGMIVVLTLPDSDRLDGGAEGHAERFKLQMQHAREQALLRNYVYGIEFAEQEYRFYRWQEGAWVLQTNPPLAPTVLDNPYYFTMDLGDFRLLDNMREGRDEIFGRGARRDNNNEEEPPQPSVLIFESTEFIPFRITFGHRDTITAGVVLDGRSGIQFEREDAPQW